jgi:hypothetical protein
MSNKQNKKRAGRPERRISVRAVRRDPPDIKKLSQALIALAMAQAEKDAQEQQEGRADGGTRRSA